MTSPDTSDPDTTILAGILELCTQHLHGGGTSAGSAIRFPLTHWDIVVTLCEPATWKHPHLAELRTRLANVTITADSPSHDAALVTSNDNNPETIAMPPRAEWARIFDATGDNHHQLTDALETYQTLRRDGSGATVAIQIALSI